MNVLQLTHCLVITFMRFYLTCTVTWNTTLMDLLVEEALGNEKNLSNFNKWYASSC
jgi:hypothetical protein